jgi:sortase A
MVEERKIKTIRVVLITVGVALLLYPLLSYAHSAYVQYSLRAALELSPVMEREPGEARPAALPSGGNGGGPEQNDGSQAIPTDPGVSMGIIEIPKIGLSAVFVSGTDPACLRSGPGWYPGTSLPGEPGNVAIAGHRSTYGAWFRRLDRLERGDRIYLSYRDKTFTYEVEKVFATRKNDWSVVGRTDYPALTLTTCHPVGSARQRLIVRARLVQ